MDVKTTRRIVLLGKQGSGKSSLANTLFGEDLFEIKHSSICGTSECQAVSKSVHGRRITLIDTPGFSDPDRPEEELECEIVSCITECSPGPHVFFIVLKVEKFTGQEQLIITKLVQYFSEDALKYAAVVFTHGDQLPQGMTIEEFVDQNKCLSDLVKKCGGRCHVVDNKYWKINQPDGYRSNKFQVAELLNTTNKIVMENKGGIYTKEMLQASRRETEKEGRQAVGGRLKKFIVRLFWVFCMIGTAVWRIIKFIACLFVMLYRIVGAVTQVILWGLAVQEATAAAAVVAVEVVAGLIWGFVVAGVLLGHAIVGLVAIAAPTAVLGTVAVVVEAVTKAVGAAAATVIAALMLGGLIAAGAGPGLGKVIIRSLRLIFSAIRTALEPEHGRVMRWVNLNMHSFNHCFQRRARIIFIIVLFGLLVCSCDFG